MSSVRHRSRPSCEGRLIAINYKHCWHSCSRRLYPLALDKLLAIARFGTVFRRAISLALSGMVAQEVVEADKLTGSRSFFQAKTALVQQESSNAARLQQLDEQLAQITEVCSHDSRDVSSESHCRLLLAFEFESCYRFADESQTSTSSWIKGSPSSSHVPMLQSSTWR